MQREADVRRQLEGRVERVEHARSALRELEGRLSTWRWRKALRSHPNAIASAITALRELDEAAERIERRAAAEGWSESDLAPQLLRGTLELRDRVLTLARKRLGRLKRGFDEAPAATVLEKLQSLATAPLPLEPSPTEQRLLEGKLGEASAFGLWPFLVYAPALLSMVLDSPLTIPVAYSLMGVVLLWTFLRSGRFWLTTERLVWKPFVGEPVEVPLASIPDGGVELRKLRGHVYVRGKRDVAVRFVENAERLAAMLELRREAPFDRLGPQPQVTEVAVYTGRRSAGAGATSEGMVVLRPDYAAFFPADCAPGLLASIRHDAQPPAVPIPLAELIEQLRALPEATFDAMIARGVEATGGSLLVRGTAQRDPSSPVWKDIALSDPATSLHGSVDWRQLEVAERLVRDWRATHQVRN